MKQNSELPIFSSSSPAAGTEYSARLPPRTVPSQSEGMGIILLSHVCFSSVWVHPVNMSSFTAQAKPSWQHSFVCRQSCPGHEQPAASLVRLPNFSQPQPSSQQFFLHWAKYLSFEKQVIPPAPRFWLQHLVSRQLSSGEEHGSSLHERSSKMQPCSIGQSSWLEYIQQALMQLLSSCSEHLSVGHFASEPQPGLHAPSCHMQWSCDPHAPSSGIWPQIDKQASEPFDLPQTQRSVSHSVFFVKNVHPFLERLPTFSQLHSVGLNVPNWSYVPSVSPSVTWPFSHASAHSAHPSVFL
mmetsp:Transcript_68822/g.182772  ORF Transcript_68822/g.182772 Transcript_68822/m.182772 type:complete len:297 (+) Transcript_68822:370-1260(+)